MSDREMYLARGKLLGGSSSTNATLYHRGTAADYDGWDLPGWKGDDVLPWFVNMEDNPAFGNSKYHSTGNASHTLSTTSQSSTWALMLTYQRQHETQWSYCSLFRCVSTPQWLLGSGSFSRRLHHRILAEPTKSIKHVAHQHVCMQ